MVVFTKRRLLGTGLLIIYGFALCGSIDNIEVINDNFDGTVAMFQATSGLTGTTAYINLNPSTVVDKQAFNLEADHLARGVFVTIFDRS